jgi:hypothetical protein
MAVELLTSSLRLDRAHWSADTAIRSGEEESERTVGLRGLVAETHHAYAMTVRGVGGGRMPSAAALAVNATTTYVMVATVPIDPAPGLDTLRVVVDCADAQIEVRTGTGYDVDWNANGLTTTRELLELDVRVEPTATLLTVEMRRNATSASYYGHLLRDLAAEAADMPTE